MTKRILTLFFLFLTSTGFAQLLTWSPDFPLESTTGLVITADASKGNKGLQGYNPNDVYVHIGVITTASSSGSDWKYVKTTWPGTDPAAKATPLGGDKWSFTITPDLRTYFGVTNPSEKIKKIAILFRSGDGNRKLANEDQSDMYVPVYTTDLSVRFSAPPFQPTYITKPETITKSEGDNIQLTAISNKTATIKIYLNGTEIQSASGVTTLTANPVLDAGTQTVKAEATDGSITTSQTFTFFVAGAVNVAPLPAGVRDGINIINSNTVTLVLYAPGKTRVGVIGDLPGSGWAEKPEYQMNKTPDGNYWWITITGLLPNSEYGFQYLVDGVLRIADPYAEKIQDPYNDQYIPWETYPGLKPYPTGSTTEVVSLFKINNNPYTWTTTGYTRPDKRNLIVYELLVRDFVAKHDWKTLKDSINYFKRLGINAIELMPVNEFEGNLSWGYNPDFYFAPDKYYGPANDMKAFIDLCHANGIAVIMDIALNHSFGMSPLVRLYWDAANSRPAANNPWYNPVAKHAFNVGYDFNHESPQTKYFVSRVLSYWLTEYKVDGFRFDLSKGFTQKQTCDNNGNNCDVAAWGAYDQSRIDILKAYYDTLQKYSPGSYSILEHFADNSEETVLSSYGMLLWGNMNYNYSQASMGWSTDWDFSYGIASQRGWSDPHLVTYMESHDEERVMYKDLQFGNSYGGTPSYNIKNLSTALQRQKLTAAFTLTIPGPKLIWQFGELGYDYSINYCQDGTINSSCRTDAKPIKWDYYQDPERRALFDVYSKLNALRKDPGFAPAFTSNAIDKDFSGAFKWLRLSTQPGKVVVMGNFDVTPKTQSVSFPTSGTWYDYMDGSPFTATGGPQSFTLQAGEFRIFTNAQVAVPVTLISFKGNAQEEGNYLVWNVGQERNVATYDVERSTDGNSFNAIGKVEANGSLQYSFLDRQASGAVTYYRIKMVDRDGSFEYSAIVSVHRNSIGQRLQIISNPFSGVLRYKVESGEAGTGLVVVSDMQGRELIRNKITLSRGINDMIIQESARLTGGMYLMKLVTGNQSISMKVIKQN